jgi:hypothetical protein
LLRAGLTGRRFRGVKSLGDEKTPNHQIVDFQPTDSGATD